MSVMAEFSVVPMGTGTSASSLVSAAIKIVAESGISYKTNPMGTVLEGEWDEVLGVIKQCHDAVTQQAGRAITTIRIDDRPGQDGRLERKLAAIEEKLGMRLNR